MVTGLRKSGASVNGAAAFFLTNPTLNPAVLVFLVLTLGWKWSLLRLGLGIVLVIGTALVLSRFASDGRVPRAPAPQNDVHIQPPSYRSWPARWLQSLLKLSVGLLPEYVIVVLLLGAIRAFLFPAAGPGLGNSLPVIIGLAVAGTLFVIPTAGEIPIIQTMLSFGMGAGPAGALLLTLAPVSAPSLLMVSRVFPKRALVAMAALVACAGIAAALLAIALSL